MFPNRLRKEQEGPDIQKIQKLGKALEEAEAVIIGAGAGLSTSAGFVYTGERFQAYFSDFEEKYGFHDMYSGGFYPYKTLEEYWAYWSRYIYLNRYMDTAFRKQDLKKSGFFIPREIMDCFNAQNPAVRKPGIMKRS